jgi:hypothetical protein
MLSQVSTCTEEEEPADNNTRMIKDEDDDDSSRRGWKTTSSFFSWCFLKFFSSTVADCGSQLILSKSHVEVTEIVVLLEWSMNGNRNKRNTPHNEEVVVVVCLLSGCFSLCVMVLMSRSV